MLLILGILRRLVKYWQFNNESLCASRFDRIYTSVGVMTFWYIFCVICSKQGASIMSKQCPIPQRFGMILKHLKHFESILSQQSKKGFGSLLLLYVCFTSTSLHGKTSEFWIANHGPKKNNPKKQAYPSITVPSKELTYPPASRHEFESMILGLSRLVGSVSSSFLDGNHPVSHLWNLENREVWIGWEAP